MASSDAKLMRNLKMIRTCKYASQFCRLLINAQEMRDENREQKKKLRVDFQSSSPDVNTFLGIKKILKHESADGLVKIFLKALFASKETPCEKKQEELLKILSKSDCEPTEYLNQLIGAVDSLVEFFFRPDLHRCCPDLKERIYEKKLVLLEEFTFRYGKLKALEVCHEMFSLGIQKYDFSLGEKKEIGDLVIEAMPYIGKIFEQLCYDFNYGVEIFGLQERSSVQFFKDLLADYSVEHETLKEFIGSLDALMKAQDSVSVWSEYAHLYDPNDDSSFLSDEAISDKFCDVLEEFNYAGARCVPKEHTWWQVYKKLFLQ